MKFIGNQFVFETNKIMKDLSSQEGIGNIVEMEVYSCKQTKESKKNNVLPKPLRFLISALEQHLPDYDFSETSMNAFQIASKEKLFTDLDFAIMTAIKNSNDANKILAYWTIVLKSILKLDKTQFYIFNFIEDKNNLLYLLYEKNGNKVVILKVGNLINTN
ncbi:YA60 [Hepatospora eriocheir]|uniref:YA60 n=1 Tax=Hepatospora eriocheir TaxID=1081669 RepID=A0A1X0QHI5_9MICR|nr:YA60 [Hepatospora eriocheir]